MNLTIGRRRAVVLLFENARWRRTNHTSTRGMWMLAWKLIAAGRR
jgi:hypothetical protein